MLLKNGDKLYNAYAIFELKQKEVYFNFFANRLNFCEFLCRDFSFFLALGMCESRHDMTKKEQSLYRLLSCPLNSCVW